MFKVRQDQRDMFLEEGAYKKRQKQVEPVDELSHKVLKSRKCI